MMVFNKCIGSEKKKSTLLLVEKSVNVTLTLLSWLSIKFIGADGAYVDPSYSLISKVPTFRSKIASSTVGGLELAEKEET